MMAKALSCLLILLSLPREQFAQSWEFVRKQDVGQEITAVDAGALGKIYVGTVRGNVYSFHADGTPDTHFSSAVFQPVTTIDASNSLRLFIFYKDASVFEFLDRFSAQPRTYYLRDFGLDYAESASLGINNTIWFFTGSELVQVNPLNHTVLTRQTLYGTKELNEVNQVEAADGWVLSNNLGIHILKSNLESIYFQEASKVKHFTIQENELVTKAEKGVLLLNCMTTFAEWLEAPDDDFESVIRSQDYFHFVKGSTIVTYRWMK